MVEAAIASVAVFPKLPRLRVVGDRHPPPPRRKNKDYRTREYLTEKEVERLIAQPKRNGRTRRYGRRDILICYRLGLRASELCALTWRHVNFDEATIYVERLKHGKSRELAITGKMIRALRQVRLDWRDGVHIFRNERGAPMSPDGFAKIVERAGEKSRLQQEIGNIHPKCCVTGSVTSSRTTGSRRERSKIISGIARSG